MMFVYGFDPNRDAWWNRKWTVILPSLRRWKQVPGEMWTPCSGLWQIYVQTGNNFDREECCCAQGRACFCPLGTVPPGLILWGSIRWKGLVGSLPVFWSEHLKAPRTNYVFVWKYTHVLRALLSRDTILRWLQPGLPSPSHIMHFVFPMTVPP